MEDLLYVGQWQGFFKYGKEYGTIVEGQEAEFRLFIEKYHYGEFCGRIIDWEGFGVDGEVSEVKGFVDGIIINFVKQYSTRYIIDEFGNNIVDGSLTGHKVIYQGQFNKEKNYFSGDWEIVIDSTHTPELTIQEVATGTWIMYRH